MTRKREFGEGPIFTITNYIFWFMTSGFYFGICNILFVITLIGILAVPIENANPLLTAMLFIAAIPAGPAITALLSVMGKLVREKDVNVTRDYFKAYKQSFKQSLFIWLIELAAIGILFVDLIFFRKQSYGQFIVPFIYAIGIIVMSMGLHAFPLISRFYLKTKDVLRLSFYYAIVKYKVTFLNVAALIIGGFVLYRYTLIGAIFGVSGIAFLIMYYEKELLKELEDQFEQNGSNKNNHSRKEELSTEEQNIFSDKLNDSLK